VPSSARLPTPPALHEWGIAPPLFRTRAFLVRLFLHAPKIRRSFLSPEEGHVFYYKEHPPRLER
jgi:hypothetical protein